MTTAFVPRLLARIEELGLSRNKAARLAGIPERRFGHYVKRRADTGEPGEPGFEDLLKICRALNTTPNYLLGVTDDPSPEIKPNGHARLGRRLKRLGRIIERTGNRLG